MIRIAPSILSADFGHLAREIGRAEEGGADWIHVDVMDGHFVPNLTIGPLVVEAAREATALPLDVHLMMEHPDRYVEDFRSAGADRITVHQEAVVHLHRTVERIRELGASPGVAVNPGTSLQTVEEIVSHVDLLLLMTVNPGFAGQAFIRDVMGKLRRAAERWGGDPGRSAPLELQVDGGIDERTAPAAVEAGATVLVAGSAVFRHPDGAVGGIRAIRRALGEEDR